ncbi:MarR family transcriptional regulator [Dokdonia pacifica]|uniref:DNA-binding transcriptional regulator, MarR family n=1 Tax=Dokdonia pacifica TaxID=1627892 RepID=A0A239DXT2_9FLAO|nr:MarR family transcriptional regulator [Dokdonia pacifica]GGG41454.1 MarR family transcriptional regulator [Dokdonia pacifica]SNS36951.1 DNA-binding transcriptional regulator, MarR family [Dokdonia pacifica]
MRDKTIDFCLRYTWQAVIKMYNEQASKYDATMAHAFALLSIDPEEGTPSTALGPRMGMEATSLSRTLKTMEDKNLIVRKPNPADGRSVLIYLTEDGQRKRQYAKDHVLQFNDTIRENVSEEEILGFYKVIETINDLVQNKKIFNQEETIHK